MEEALDRTGRDREKMCIRDRAKAAPLEGFLYQGEDMIEYNLGMDMTVKGVKGYYPLITAGVNWYEAYHECEFLMDDTDVFEFYSKSILGGEQYQHSIELKGLPARPKKATRLLLDVYKRQICGSCKRCL